MPPDQLAHKAHKDLVVSRVTQAHKALLECLAIRVNPVLVAQLASLVRPVTQDCQDHKVHKVQPEANQDPKARR